jgi:hypothetical protein
MYEMIKFENQKMHIRVTILAPGFAACPAMFSILHEIAQVKPFTQLICMLYMSFIGLHEQGQ